MEKVTLHIGDLSDDLDDDLYNQLQDNFLIIQKALNGKASGPDIDETIKNQLQALEGRINRITVSGVDQVALSQLVDQAVESALKRKGVSN